MSDHARRRTLAAARTKALERVGDGAGSFSTDDLRALYWAVLFARKGTPLPAEIAGEMQLQGLELALEALVDARLSGRATAAAPPTTKGESEIRPIVQAFALMMEEQLRANDHKGGWDNDSPQQLFHRLMEEAEELRVELESAWQLDAYSPAEPLADEIIASIRKEAADVANFAMMIVGVCDGLPADATSRPDATTVRTVGGWGVTNARTFGTATDQEGE